MIFFVVNSRNDGQGIDYSLCDTQPPIEENISIVSQTLRTQPKKDFIVPTSYASKSNSNDYVCDNGKVNDGPAQVSESTGITEMSRPTFMDNDNIFGEENKSTEALDNQSDHIKNATNNSFDNHVDIQNKQMPNMSSRIGTDNVHNIINDKNIQHSSPSINHAKGNQADINDNCHYNSEEECCSMSILEDAKDFSRTGLDIQRELTNSLNSLQKMSPQKLVIEEKKELCCKELFCESGSNISEMNADVIFRNVDSKDTQMKDKEVTVEPVDKKNIDKVLNMKRDVTNGTGKQDFDINSPEENCIIPLKVFTDKPKPSDTYIVRNYFQADFLDLGKETQGTLKEHTKVNNMKVHNVTIKGKVNENKCTNLLDKLELLGCSHIKTNVQSDSSETFPKVRDVSSYVKVNEYTKSKIPNQENSSGLTLIVKDFCHGTDKDTNGDKYMCQTLQYKHVENILNEHEKVTECSLLKNESVDLSLIRLKHLETSSKEHEHEIQEQKNIEHIMIGGNKSRIKSKDKVKIDENADCPVSLDMNTIALGDETPAGISLTKPVDDSISLTFSQGFEVTDILTPLELSLGDKNSSQPFNVKDIIHALEKGKASTIDKGCSSKGRDDDMKITEPYKNDNEDVQNMVTQKKTHLPFCDSSSETTLQHPDLYMNSEKNKMYSTDPVETLNQSKQSAKKFQEETEISEDTELENEIMNEISDSQLCEVSHQTEVEQRWQESCINTVKQFEKRKQEGQDLLNTILKEIKSINDQVLRLKREIEMAKYKMESISTETKLKLSKPEARRQFQIYGSNHFKSGNGRL